MTDKKEVFFNTHSKELPVFFSNHIVREIPMISDQDRALMKQGASLQISQYYTSHCDTIFPNKLISKLFLPDE